MLLSYDFLLKIKKKPSVVKTISHVNKKSFEYKLYIILVRE